MKLVGEVFGCGAGVRLMLIVGLFSSSLPSGVLGAPLMSDMGVVPEHYLQIGEGHTNLGRNEGSSQLIGVGGQTFGTGNDGEQSSGSGGSSFNWNWNGLNHFDRSGPDAGTAADADPTERLKVDQGKLNVCQVDRNASHFWLHPKRFAGPPVLKVEGEHHELIAAKPGPGNDSKSGEDFKTEPSSSGTGSPVNNACNRSNVTTGERQCVRVSTNPLCSTVCQMWCGASTMFYLAWGLLALAMMVIILELCFLVFYVLKQQQPNRIYYVEVLEQLPIRQRG